MPQEGLVVEPEAIVLVTSIYSASFVEEREDGSVVPFGTGLAYVDRVEDGIVYARPARPHPQAMPERR